MAATTTLTARQLNRATLARQMLLEREQIAPAEAVARLAGMQAQEAKPPHIGLWTRLEAFRSEQLNEALRDRSVVRGTLMRATLHLFAATDFVAARHAFQPEPGRIESMLGARAEGLDLERVLPVAQRLFEEEPRTFSELRPLLQEEFPEVNERALGYATRLHLPLVMVPTADRWGFPAKASFTTAEAWLAEPHRDDGGRELLARRYLGAFGPAGVADFQTWSGLSRMKDVFAEMRDELEVFRDENGRELFDLPDAPRPEEDVPAPARFLPEFDNLVLSHADRTRVIDDQHRPALVTKNLRVRATFLVDGRVAGTWTSERKRGSATLIISPFTKLPKRAAKALEAEGERLLRFVEEDAGSHAVTWAEPA